MMEVLRARVSSDMCPDESCSSLVALSGGVLRDLILLTQAAVKEAYVEGDDQVTLGHVATVADDYGRTQLIGLAPDKLEILQNLQESNHFIQSDDRHLALLHTRLVLEYRDGARVRYRVHPTVLALFEQLKAS